MRWPSRDGIEFLIVIAEQEVVRQIVFNLKRQTVKSVIVARITTLMPWLKSDIAAVGQLSANGVPSGLVRVNSADVVDIIRKRQSPSAFNSDVEERIDLNPEPDPIRDNRLEPA